MGVHFYVQKRKPTTKPTPTLLSKTASTGCQILHLHLRVSKATTTQSVHRALLPIALQGQKPFSESPSHCKERSELNSPSTFPRPWPLKCCAMPVAPPLTPPGQDFGEGKALGLSCSSYLPPSSSTHQLQLGAAIFQLVPGTRINTLMC